MGLISVWRTSCLFLFFYCFGTGVALYNSLSSFGMDLEGLVQKGHLTAESLKPIRDLSTSFQSKIKLLYKTEGDKTRLIVLLGENHVIKTWQELSTQKELLSHFEYRALEGATSGDSKCLGCLQLLWVPCISGFGWIVSHTCHGEDASAIGHAYTVPHVEDKEHFIIWLEEGHVPDISEKVSAGVLAATFASALTSLTLYHFQPGATLAQNVLLGTEIALGGSVILGSVAESFCQRRISPKLSRWIGINGLLYGRNLTMVRNLVDTLEEHPEIQTVAVVVGAGHIAGLVGLLTEEQGYTALDINPTPLPLASQPLLQEHYQTELNSAEEML